jgi:hypothetical protein
MVTPAYAEQTNISQVSQPQNVNYSNQITQCMSIFNALNDNKTVEKTQKSVNNVSNSKSSVKSNKKDKYASTVQHAAEILPIMQESYENSSDELTRAGNALNDLQLRQEQTTKHLAALKEKLESYEVSTNNTGEYKKLQTDYKEYNRLKTDIKETETSINELKQVLNKKKACTGNCVVALKQIKKSENITQALASYQNNIQVLNTISNNLADVVKNNTEYVIVSNNTPTNVTNSSNSTNSTDSDMNKEGGTVKNIFLSGVVLSGVSIPFWVTGTAILGAAYVKTMKLLVECSLASSTEVGEYVFASGLGESIATASTVGVVFAVVGAVIALAGLACLIAYAGTRWHWWSL